MRTRCAGSSDIQVLRTRSSPSAGARTATSTTEKSPSLGTPRGGETRWISRPSRTDIVPSGGDARRRPGLDEASDPLDRLTALRQDGGEQRIDVEHVVLDDQLDFPARSAHLL